MVLCGFGTCGKCRSCFFADLAFGGVEMRLVAHQGAGAAMGPLRKKLQQSIGPLWPPGQLSRHPKILEPPIGFVQQGLEWFIGPLQPLVPRGLP